MFFIGKKNIKSEKLVEITFNSMWEGIKKVKPGNTLGDIGNSIQTYAEKYGYSVVRDFCGHGIGKVFHCAPNILHYGEKGQGMKLREGMIFTIEPMINLGKSDIKILNDGWTAVTRDKKLSAQFEHTIGVTKNGCEVFTLSENERDFVYHAGTKTVNGKLFSIGGRVLNFTSIGNNLFNVRKKIIKMIKRYNWKNGFFRKDIGWKILD